ncbi:MAG: DUF805 domain-containing protein, partial [Ruminococcus sp.]|nr:DUF805 domain-containing protein [Ruminococcus sp.]
AQTNAYGQSGYGQSNSYGQAGSSNAQTNAYGQSGYGQSNSYGQAGSSNAQTNAYGQSGYGQSKSYGQAGSSNAQSNTYGQSGYGQSNSYGQTGSSNAQSNTYGQTGYGQSNGYGQTGSSNAQSNAYGQSGYGQSNSYGQSGGYKQNNSYGSGGGYGMPFDTGSYNMSDESPKYVDMIEALILFFKNFFNFRGRSTRSEYWYMVLWSFIFESFLKFIGIFVGTSVSNSLIYFVTIALCIPNLAVSVRRLHDVGKSGWWVGIQYIIIAIMLVILFVSRSFHGAFVIFVLGILTALAIAIMVLIFTIRPSEGPNKWGMPAAPKFRI